MFKDIQSNKLRDDYKSKDVIFKFTVVNLKYLL